MRLVYLREEEFEDPPEPFRTGEAGFVWLTPDGDFETETRVALSANSTHALLGHGVVDALNRLPLEGELGHGVQVVVPPAALDAARALFYEADRRSYGATYEFVANGGAQPDVEYRVRIDNREYQRSLMRLTYLTTVASREGKAVWLRI